MRSSERGFTLIEILVVVAIILAVAIIALPVLNSLNGRQVTDGARILTGSLVGARDSAIRYNQPRGIRLLPDPTLTIPPPGQPGAGTIQLVYNRMIPIEPAGDLSQGKLTIGPQYWLGGTPDTTKFPPFYTAPDGGVYQYPFYESPDKSKVLMVEESPYLGGFVVGTGEPNSPTNWYWTVRVGDKIKINGTGRAYTIVGPCTINPWATTASGNQGNPEMFVNVGPPGTQSPLARTYYQPDPTVVLPLPQVKKYGATLHPEFLFLVNGENDTDGGYGHTGYTDEGFDGRNNNSYPPPIPKPGDPVEYSDLVMDDLTEWEDESWAGAVAADTLQDLPVHPPIGSPSGDWVVKSFVKGTQDVTYTIKRRPVPSPGSRETTLPAGVVIDATTWNTTRERSRLPVEPGSLHCDILVNPSGLYVPTTLYSTPTSADPLPFVHLWVTQRAEVFPRGSVWGSTNGVPNHNPSDSDTAATAPYINYELPMTSDTPSYPPNATAPVLKEDRRLVTMFTQSGLVVTNTVETIPAPSVVMAAEGFNVGNVNTPFLKAQQGAREAR